MTDAASLHQAAIVVDGHSDVFCDVADRRGAGETGVLNRLHLPAWRAGGVNVVVTTLFVEPSYKPDRALRRAMTLLGAALHDLDETPEATLCRTRAEIDAAVAAGRVAFVLGMEGGEPLQDSPEALRVFSALGLRVLGLTWNGRNLLAEGVGDPGADAGLTALGRRVVREANRLGVLLDVSHLTARSFWDLLEESSGPVIASHSNARALRDHPRNLDDAQIRALAATGGTIGINLVSAFLGQVPAEVDIKRVVAQIDYIADLVGPEHVALGPDFVDYLALEPGLVGAIDYPVDLPTIAALPRLTAALVQRGYSEGAIRGILGENFLRVLTTVTG